MRKERAPVFEYAPTTSADDALARGVALATALTDARANQLTPTGFAETAVRLAAPLPLHTRVTGADELRAGGHGGITAIGAGSSRPPALLEMWIGPSSDAPPTGALALAGKGVTFDTGGLSLKSAAAMHGMHTDCAGAAAVLAAMLVLADTGHSEPVVAAMPLVENVPGPDSARPGDVVRARNGLGIEIVDTDFEGRVILADALSCLAETSPTAIVSAATLTHQSVIALGDEIAAVLARDDALGAHVLAAATRADEAMWRLPWATRYAHRLVSCAPGADVRNHPLNDSGRAITAALFLGAFVPPHVPYAHIDLAGPAVEQTPDGPQATGFGVRTLVEVARTIHPHHSHRTIEAEGATS